MGEKIELYDIYGNKTGKIFDRAEGVLEKGETYLTIHCYIRTKEGLYLVQRRAGIDSEHPGRWDITCGTVRAGETGVQACIREVQEEDGISVSEKQLHFVARIRRDIWWIDIFTAEIDVRPEDCTKQDEEVHSIHFLTENEMFAMVFDKEGRDREYRDMMKAVLRAV